MVLRELAGNAPLKRILTPMERPPHAVIISGPVGSGRHTLAKLLAQAHVCTGAEHPCGQCPDCRRVFKGIHPDVQDLERFVPEADREKDVKVSVVRDIRADAQVAPNQARRKVYVIDRPINPNAQNAMLKLLEEGPDYAAFLLVTENSAALLETVRSRCAQLRTGPVSAEEAVQWLQRRFPDRSEQELQQAAAESQGLLGQALALLEEEEQSAPPETSDWVRALSRGSERALMECAARVQTDRLSRDAAEQLWLALERAFRGALAVQLGLESGTPEEQALAGALGQRQLLRCQELTAQAREMGTFNVAPAHSAGWLAVKLAQAAGRR